MPKTARKNWIDVARGFAMIFVVFGHSGNHIIQQGIPSDKIYELICMIINSVKLPLFFAVSGLLFSDKNKDALCFFKRMGYSRLIPYAVYGTLSGIIATLVDFARCGFQTELIPRLFVSNYIQPFLQGLRIWFIPCLIVIELIFFILLKLSKKNTAVLIALAVICTGFGYFISSDHTMKPWKFDTALTCIQFMTFGYLLKKADFSKIIVQITSIFVYAFLFISMNSVWNGCVVNVNEGVYFNPIAFSMLAFTGITAFFSVSSIFSKVKALCFVGKNTLMYFVFHVYVMQIVFVCIPMPLKLPMWCLGLVLLLITCILTGGICIFINKYLWFTTGKKR